MRIAPTASPRRRLSLTSLIDVIFLLLLFFMLSSTFSKYNEFELSPGSAGGAQSASQRPSILLSVNGENWRLNGEPTGAADLGEKIRGAITPESNHAVIVTRGETTSQQLVTVLEILRSIKGLRVTIAR
ncbi:MAG: biopolymer transporter ExbD [Pseudomonadota bacterium]